MNLIPISERARAVNTPLRSKKMTSYSTLIFLWQGKVKAVESAALVIERENGKTSSVSPFMFNKESLGLTLNIVKRKRKNRESVGIERKK